MDCDKKTIHPYYAVYLYNNVVFSFAVVARGFMYMMNLLLEKFSKAGHNKEAVMGL